MKIVARYDFNGGVAAVERNYKVEYGELVAVITSIDAALYKTKVSKEKTMRGRQLYNPTELNAAFKRALNPRGWHNKAVVCDYKQGEYLAGYQPSAARKGVAPFRDMDFIRGGTKLGVEVQFGKYAFMVYNVCAKMTIFKNLGHIDTGVEIVPVKRFADSMSTGVSYFEQFAWDLSQRGVSDIDIPVLILGIDA